MVTLASSSANVKAIPEQADIVIVSQGGAPKDLNLYQNIDNANAVKKVVL